MRLSRIGSQIAAMATTITNERVRQPWRNADAGGDVEKSRRRAAARPLEDEQRHAAPDEAGRERHHDVGDARERDDEAVERIR